MFTVTAIHRRAASRPGPRSALVAAMDCWRSRRALSRLDAHALADIGIGGAAARGEAARPVWDVPASWLR